MKPDGTSFFLQATRKTVSWKLSERRMPRNERTWRMRQLFFVLIFTVEQRVSSNYLHKFWKQVFAYRNDVEYTIDNLAAERAIRPQTIQRKGSLFFGRVQGALRSAMYNTFIQTCKQVGVSYRQYFKALLKAVKSGRTDYENLLPMTISLD